MAARHGRLALVAGLVAALLAPATVSGAGPTTPKPLETTALPGPKASPAEAFAPGRVLVRFNPRLSRASRRLTLSAAGVSSTPGDGTTLAPQSADQPVAAGLVPGLAVVETQLPVDLAVARLEAQPGVEYAEPDRVITAARTPNDPFLSQMWGLDQATDADIDAKAAWDTATGSPNVVVAVIDSGIQHDHPDLAANLWTNPGEIAGNGIDDDGDGYVDDIHGWDFVDDDNLPDDPYGHGTHVAGTIAAVGNNGIGVVGVAYTSKVMPLRILDANGAGYVSDAVRAIDFAARHGVRISNNSWGYSGSASQVLRDAIAVAGDAGQLFVVAAGNNAADIDQVPDYPGSYDLPNIITVAAMDQQDQLSLFSNVGPKSVDIAAPGEQILSTLPTGYGLGTGTSMASPHVAGVAALVLSVHPTWTTAQIRDRILRTARPVASLEGLVASGGMVNAAAAVGGSPNLAPVVTITKPASGTSVLRGSTVTFAATAVDPEQGNVGSSIIWVSSLMGEIGTGPTISRGDLTEGTHVIVAIARDFAHHTPLAAITLRIGPEVRTIDEHADPRSPAISATSGGSPVLAWSERGTGIVVSRPGGAGWSREVVSTSAADGSPDVAVAADGTVRLAISRDWSNPGAFRDTGILVATDDGTGAGTGWKLTRVSEGCGDDAIGCGLDATPSIAVNGSGRAQAAWSRAAVPDVPVSGNGPGLWHAAERANGSWSTELAVAVDGGVASPHLAIGPDGAAHVAYARYDAGNEGVYEATNETGSWVETRLAPLAAGEHVGWTRIAVAADDRVDVAWGTADGVSVATRTAGTWGAPALATTDPAGDVDLVRTGSTLHIVIGLVEGLGHPSGIAYAASIADGPWTVEPVDAGNDVTPRLAVDAGGHAHLSYLRAAPEHEVRYATNATGGWATQVVDAGSDWGRPAFGVDAAGVRHVAVGRTGEQPGVWYGTDAGGHWTMTRLTTEAPDGAVGLAVAPDGTASIAYAEFFAADGTPLADRAVKVITGKPGAWATTRIADDTGDASPAIARDAAGHIHVAYGTNAGGLDRLAYATNASGSWVVTPATPGASGQADRHPAIAVDAEGKAHIAFERSTDDPLPDGTISIGYATNASGAWTDSTVTSGPEYRLDPSIALDATGKPRIAYGIDNGDGALGSAGGVRLATFNGATWATATLSSSPLDGRPSLAIDTLGRNHVLFARDAPYSICADPLCPSAPGLRYWSDMPGFGAARRVTDNADDTFPAIVRGPDGSVSGAFVDVDWRLADIRVLRPLPTATAPAVHLAGAGTTLAQGKAAIVAALGGSGAATYRLQESVNGAAYATVGAVSSATSRAASLLPSTTTTRRYRVIPTDVYGRVGGTVYGPTFRVSIKSEAKSSTLTYAGAWSTTTGSSYLGGAARRATSSSARVTYRFTGREVTWIAAKGASRGKARVYVDGVLASTIDLHAGATHYRRVIFRAAWSASGTHSITIRPMGNGRVDVDGFEVLR